MDCGLIREQLLSFHVGVEADVPRDEIEAHLVGCSSCVRAFLDLRRVVESDTERPSEMARARLRRDVARELASRRPRRLAMAVALAGAAVIALVAFRMGTWQKAPPPFAPAGAVDSADPHESVRSVL